jgi:DNA mismatch endonuclease (patch repair protein)
MNLAKLEVSELDRVDQETRSKNMSRVRAKNTTPELAVRRMAHRLGLRFRIHRKDLPGKPDLVFPKHRLVVFVNGCFWHRHPKCRRATMPATRIEFWRAKFEATETRDADHAGRLNTLGWKVLTIWECELKHPELIAAKLLDATSPMRSRHNAGTHGSTDGELNI